MYWKLGFENGQKSIRDLGYFVMGNSKFCLWPKDFGFNTLSHFYCKKNTKLKFLILFKGYTYKVDR